MFEHQNIVSVIETSSKMASTLCQKRLPFFVKEQKKLYSLDHTILFKFHQRVVHLLDK